VGSRHQRKQAAHRRRQSSRRRHHGTEPALWGRSDHRDGGGPRADGVHESRELLWPPAQGWNIGGAQKRGTKQPMLNCVSCSCRVRGPMADSRALCEDSGTIRCSVRDDISCVLLVSRREWVMADRANQEDVLAELSLLRLRPGREHQLDVRKQQCLAQLSWSQAQCLCEPGARCRRRGRHDLSQCS
jgi:hypothetical protein